MGGLPRRQSLLSGQLSIPILFSQAEAAECGALQSGRSGEGSGHGFLYSSPAAGSAHRSIH